MTTGIDYSTANGLDTFFRPLIGNRATAERLWRRLTTPPGLLIGNEAEGLDVRDMCNEEVDELSMTWWKAAIEEQCRREETVHDVVADLEADTGSGRVTVDINFITGEGPFQLVLSVDQLQVERIR